MKTLSECKDQIGFDNGCIDWNDLMSECSGYKEAEEYLDAVSKMYASQFTPKWIAVTPESLPEDQQRILVYVANIDQVHEDTYYKKQLYGFRFNSVTHWQPLPEPPKQD